MLRTHFCVDICTFYDKIRENDVEEEHRVPDRVAGVIVINLTPGGMAGGFQWMGEGLILVCSMAYGASSVTLKLLSGKETPTAITAFQLLFGGGMLILAGVLLGGHVRGFTMRSVLLLLYMALLSTAAFSIWALLLKYNPVGKVAVFGFTIPVSG